RYPGREPRTRATVSVSSWARVISSRVVVMGAPQGVAALRRLKTLAPSHRANNGSAASEPIGVVGGELLERDCGPADDVRDRRRDLARLAPRVVGVVLEQTIDLPRREDAPQPGREVGGRDVDESDRAPGGRGQRRRNLR